MHCSCTHKFIFISKFTIENLSDVISFSKSLQSAALLQWSSFNEELKGELITSQTIMELLNIFRISANVCCGAIKEEMCNKLCIFAYAHDDCSKFSLKEFWYFLKLCIFCAGTVHIGVVRKQNPWLPWFPHSVSVTNYLKAPDWLLHNWNIIELEIVFTSSINPFLLKLQLRRSSEEKLCHEKDFLLSSQVVVSKKNFWIIIL